MLAKDAFKIAEKAKFERDHIKIQEERRDILSRIEKAANQGSFSLSSKIYYKENVEYLVKARYNVDKCHGSFSTYIVSWEHAK